MTQKNMKTLRPFFFISLTAIAALLACNAPKGTASKKTAKDRFLDSLLSVMTIDEKIGQLNLPL